MQSVKELRKRILSDIERCGLRISMMEQERRELRDILKYLEACEQHEGEIRMKNEISNLDRPARALKSEEEEAEKEKTIAIISRTSIEFKSNKQKILEELGKLQAGHFLRAKEISKRLGIKRTTTNQELHNLYKKGEIKKTIIPPNRVFYSLPS